MCFGSNSLHFFAVFTFTCLPSTLQDPTRYIAQLFRDRTATVILLNCTGEAFLKKVTAEIDSFKQKLSQFVNSYCSVNVQKCCLRRWTQNSQFEAGNILISAGYPTFQHEFTKIKFVILYPDRAKPDIPRTPDCSFVPKSLAPDLIREIVLLNSKELLTGLGWRVWPAAKELLQEWMDRWLIPLILLMIAIVLPVIYLLGKWQVNYDRKQYFRRRKKKQTILKEKRNRLQKLNSIFSSEKLKDFRKKSLGFLGRINLIRKTSKLEFRENWPAANSRTLFGIALGPSAEVNCNQAKNGANFERATTESDVQAIDSSDHIAHCSQHVRNISPVNVISTDPKLSFLMDFRQNRSVSSPPTSSPYNTILCTDMLNDENRTKFSLIAKTEPDLLNLRWQKGLMRSGSVEPRSLSISID